MVNHRDFVSKMSTALFPAALGLAGLGAALKFGDPILGQVELSVFSAFCLSAAAIVLAIELCLYATKILVARRKVVEDLSMATSANLLAPGFMAAMVIGGSGLLGAEFGGLLWMFASLGHVCLLIAFVGAWFRRDYRPEELNPTWFLPGAGIMTSSLMWPGFGPVELPTFTLAVGATMWVMLLPPIFRRMIVDPSVEPKLRPTLFIIAAPFGLMAGSQITLFPEIPIVVPILFLFGGTFLLMVLLSQAWFLRGAGPALTWWSSTFPIAVLTAGFFRVAEDANSVTGYIATTLLVITCLTTLFAIAATIHAGWNEFGGRRPTA